MSTSLHAVKAYHNLIPKLRGGAFDDNRIDTVSTSRRTLSSKRSARFDSNKNSLTSRDLLSENSTLRSIRTHASFAAPHGYSHSTVKTEIDEDYHQKYQQNQNELELLKYNFGMLDEKNQVMGNRVQDLEEENKNLTTKYYKIKSNYLLIKDHYNANKLVIKNLEKEISNYLQQTKDLKTELDKAINEKIHIENRNFELRNKVQALSQCQHQENNYYHNLEQDYKIQIQKLEKDNLQKFQQIQDYQEKFAAGLEDLVQKRDEVFLEKTMFIQQLRELQDKLARSLEENLQFKNEILEQKQTIHDLEKDNDVLASKLTVLTENYESYIYKEPSHREIRTSVMYQDFNTRQSMENEEIIKKYQKQQEALEQDIIELRNDKDCLTRAIDSIQEELLDSRTLFNKEKKQYEQEIEFLKQVISKNEKSYQDEINDLNNKIQNMNQEKSQLENESNKVRFDFNYLESRMTQLQDTIYKLESRNEKLEKELETAKEQNKDLITQNIKSQYETLLQDKNQEIIHFKLKDKENSLKIKELEDLIEESKLQKENEIRNQLSYSHSYSDISETETKQQPPLHQEKKSSPLKNRYYENYQIASARVYSSRDEDTTRPVLTSLNSDIQKITSRYHDIKYKYDSVKNQSHHH